MKRWRFAWAWTIGITLALGLFACGGDIPLPPFPWPTPPPAGEYDCANPPDLEGLLVTVGDPIPGELLVMLKPARELAARVDAAAELVARLPQLRDAEVFRQIGALAVEGDASLIRALLADVSVEYIQQVGRKHVTIEWGLDRIDQRGKDLDGVFDPDGDGDGVQLAIVDTGITDHPEFTGRLGADCFTAHTFGGCSDMHGHGTHVAGTAAGATFGLARAATLYAVRVLNQDGSGSDTDVIRGIEWVIEKKLEAPAEPWVINMSLGGSPSPALDSAVCRAIEAGVVNVVAAGNESESSYTSSPARVKQAITVGAIEEGDTVAWFSNHGPGLDLFAPGVAIRSAKPGGGSQLMQGTSMASPHVAGGAALYLGQHPTAAPDQVELELVEISTEGALSGVRNETPNRLLFVGKGDGGEVPPWECPIDAPWCHETDPPQTCSSSESPCVHNPTSTPHHCELAPECSAPPPDWSCPDGECGAPLRCGRPQARIYWFQDQRLADATPAICEPKRCALMGWTDNRYCCPPTQDGDPRRGPCETELMGGVLPVWELEVRSGDLSRANPGEWMFRIKGHGQGRLRWCFENGATCSKWLEVDR